MSVEIAAPACVAEKSEQPMLGRQNGCWSAGFGNVDYEASGGLGNNMDGKIFYLRKRV